MNPGTDRAGPSTDGKLLPFPADSCLAGTAHLDQSGSASLQGRDASPATLTPAIQNPGSDQMRSNDGCQTPHHVAVQLKTT